jgi:hypothetical protein
MIEFLFWFFLCGLVIACIQDLRRTEVDNWLNTLIFIGGSAFLIFSSIFQANYWFLVFGLFSFICLFIISNLMYYGRIFAGGDYRLLIAIFALFVSSSFILILENIGIFIFLLFLSGSLWGILLSLFFYLKKSKEVNREMIRIGKKFYFKYLFLACVLIAFLGIYNFIFLVLSCFILFSFVLFIFTKAIEKEVMIVSLFPNKLRLGDVLVSDVRVGKRIVKVDWGGLNDKTLGLLKKYKGKIKIKNGIPFVPAFLIAFLLFWFFKERIL